MVNLVVEALIPAEESWPAAKPAFEFMRKDQGELRISHKSRTSESHSAYETHEADLFSLGLSK